MLDFVPLANSKHEKLFKVKELFLLTNFNDPCFVTVKFYN